MINRPRWNARERHRGLAPLVLSLLLAACVENVPTVPPPSVTPPSAGEPAPLAPVTGAEVAPNPPAQPAVRIGSGNVVRPPPPAGGVQPSQDGDITLNFANASVREVIDAVLGQLLHLNYAVDPRVQGTITLQTSQPVARALVLPALESALQSIGVAMVRSGEVYRIVPLAAAARSGPASIAVSGPGQAGYGLQIIPLRYASARQLQKVLEPFVPTGSVLQVDDQRNLLLLSGTESDQQTFLRLVAVFDVDWMSGMSFALVPLQQSAATSVAQEMVQVMSSGADGALAGALRIVPIERINAILLVSPQAAYIQKAREWIDRLDAGINENAPRLYVLNVQNSRASDLAKVLSQVFGGGGLTQAEPSVEPGAMSTRLGGSSLSGGLSSTSAGGLGSSLAQAGGSTGGPGGPMGGATSGPVAPPVESGGQPAGGSAGAAAAGAAPPLVSVNVGAPGAGPGEQTQARVVADEKNNNLVVFARPREYRMIEGALRKLDLLPQQVLIEATVAEVTLNDALQYGLQWFFKTGNASFGQTFNPTGVPAAVFPGFNFVFGNTNQQVVLNALSSVTRVNVVSAPQLMVLDHQTATLQVGDQVPIAVQQARSVINPDSPIVNSLEYRNTGVILRVTPRVNSNGVATMEIEQEVSDVSRTTTSNIDSPTIAQRRIRSVVAVADGQTVALGGLIRHNRTGTRSGLPLLSDIPILGALFGEDSHSVARTELLVLLTPRVVRNPEEARAVTEELQRRLQAVPPVIIRGRL